MVSIWSLEWNDIYLNAGHPGDITSVIDGKMRNYFFTNLHATFVDNLFITRNIAEDEIWIHYPTVASVDGFCDEVLIWNYRTGTWTISDGLGARSGALGPVPGQGSVTSTFSFSGTSGSDNQDVNLGAFEVQTVSVDSAATLTTADTNGVEEQQGIEVDLGAVLTTGDNNGVNEVQTIEIASGTTLTTGDNLGTAHIADIGYSGTRSNVVAAGTDEQVSIRFANNFNSGPARRAFEVTFTAGDATTNFTFDAGQEIDSFNIGTENGSYNFDIPSGSRYTIPSGGASNEERLFGVLTALSGVQLSGTFNSQAITTTFIYNTGSRLLSSVDIVGGNELRIFLNRGNTGSQVTNADGTGSFSRIAYSVGQTGIITTPTAVGFVLDGDGTVFPSDGSGLSIGVSFTANSDATSALNQLRTAIINRWGSAGVTVSNPATVGNQVEIVIDTNQTTNINQVLIVNENGGSNTAADLSATIDGVPPSMAAMSSYQVNGPGFEMAFTSSVLTAGDSDLATLLNSMESAVDDNTEIPINYLAEQLTGPNRLRFTAQASGAPATPWSITADHRGGNGDIAFAERTIVTQGEFPQTAPTVSITRPNEDTQTFEMFPGVSPAQSRDDAQIAAEISRLITNNFGGWGTAHTTGSRTITLDNQFPGDVPLWTITVTDLGTSGTTNANFNDADFIVTTTTPGVAASTSPSITFTPPGGTAQTHELFPNENARATRDVNAIVAEVERILEANVTGWDFAVTGNAVIARNETIGDTGLWQISVANLGTSGTTTGQFNTNDFTVMVVREGEMVTMAPTVQITAPDGTTSSAELFNTATARESRTSAQIAAEIRTRFASDFTGWTVGGSGDDITFTNGTRQSITGSFSVMVTSLGTSGTTSDQFNAADFTTAQTTRGAAIEQGMTTEVTLSFLDNQAPGGRSTLVYTLDAQTAAQATTTITNDLNSNSRLDASQSSGTITVSPSQVGDAALVLTDVAITRQGTVPPATLTAYSTGVDSNFAIATENIETSRALSQGRPWPVTLLNEARQFVVVTNGSKILARDLTYQHDGVNYTSFIEKQNINPGSIDESFWWATVLPLITGDATSVTINTLSKDVQSDEEILDNSRVATFTFNPAEDYKVDIREQSRFLDIRFSDDGNQPWRLAEWNALISRGDSR